MFSDCYLDLTGGIVTVMKAQKKALEKLGHTVYIFTTGYPKTKTELEKLAKKNVFVVPSGETISFTFTPSSSYWIHEINKNGRYVGYENVKKN